MSWWRDEDGVVREHQDPRISGISTPMTGWPGDWPQVRVVFDEACPVDKAYLIDKGFLYTGVQMSKRTWWKPWTWRRHVLSLEELWPS